ncbi:nuclear transport factor 2 family protein [Enterovibrio norvegicus]|uniref:SnoaL-like domain-containing protein n=1 Tax=Enterovibrio norvegicus TaxID=188144 RepID=A0A2N7L6P4_9GAMM|nr:nuclear transport factor 2 family protein [Enterovibrio norvegicus]PML76588.1 hypothetical protein BCT69_22420 [Enterovibrio norvegicus]PMN65197.1 hypothetical protein BCT27_07120 [Enterovibrio norvegicus]PMN89613.1 hypothetical protein BCT23_23010 [Enterovibrio norvegicus]
MNTAVTEKENRSVVAAYFDALKSGDMTGLALLFDRNALWHQPGRNPFSGDKVGFGRVLAMLSRMQNVTNNSYAIKRDGSLMTSGNLVSVPVHTTASSGNLSISMKGTHLFRIDGGYIMEVWLFSEDQKAEDTFWSV